MPLFESARLNPVPLLVRASLVLAVFLLCFNSFAVAETETEDQSRTATSSLGAQQYLRFEMFSSLASTTGYPRGNGSVEVQVQGTQLGVHFSAEGMARSAHLTLLLLANGTTHSAVNMTTSYDGEVEAEATVSLAQGSYSVGLQVVDTSSFSAPMTVMVSDPSTQLLTLAQASQVTNTTASWQTQTATTVHEGESEDDDIRTAIQTKVIPAVIEVGNSGSIASVNDANFSVSIGRFQQDGYLVSISASNVVGPRVLLVNLTSDQARTLFSGPVQITLDGSLVPQASALSQVLSAPVGSPAKFVLVAGPSELNVLVLIPHFSYHTIEIVPILAQAGAILLYYTPALLFAVAAATVVVLVAYSRRTRVEI
jgi:hypothetical protein